MDGELVLCEGVSSCHKLRSALGDYPADCPLVAFTSAQLPSNTMESILSYFSTTACTLLDEHQELLRAALPDELAETAPSRCLMLLPCAARWVCLFHFLICAA